MLTQNDPEGRRGKWIAAMLKYDLEIRTKNLIRGQGLAKLMEDSNLHSLDVNFIVALSEEQDVETLLEVVEIFSLSPWYADIIHVLQHLNPLPGFSSSKDISLKLKALEYYILNGFFYCKYPGGVLLNYLVEGEVEKIMIDFHKGDCGGHLYWKTTENKILRGASIGQVYFLMFIK